VSLGARTEPQLPPETAPPAISREAETIEPATERTKPAPAAKAASTTAQAVTAPAATGTRRPGDAPRLPDDPGPEASDIPDDPRLAVALAGTTGKDRRY
jgi:hypothetical protein